MVFYAHIRKAPHRDLTPEDYQTLSAHLLQTARLAELFALKFKLPLSGRLIGLMHDLGKYSMQFQHYLLSAVGLIPPDHPDYIDPISYKGKIDHSTAGAQWITSSLGEAIRKNGKKLDHYAQHLALAVCSHHGGLPDCLDPDGDAPFAERMGQPEARTHFLESKSSIEPGIDAALQEISTKALLEELKARRVSILARENAAIEKKLAEKRVGQHSGAMAMFELGLLERALFSCLLDADRTNSADFEEGRERDADEYLRPRNWEGSLTRLEAKFAAFEAQQKERSGEALDIRTIRQEVAGHCLKRADGAKGFYTLTVPTGGGKTLASLRFALHHAQKHKLDRIFYIIPYTSIIDQNARVTREILESGLEPGSIVLEHHSNITPEEENRQNALCAANWEAPVVFTTMVQFLDSLFGAGTRGARRMHNLADSVIIFDEIQTLPLRCTHMFCRALNFLVEECGASALLCTATQPLLGALPNPVHGQLALPENAEIVPDVQTLFQSLRRVRFFDHTQKPMRKDEICNLALGEMEARGSCLVVANTIKWAEDLYTACKDAGVKNVFYLSTRLCAAHRAEIFGRITRLLGKKKVLCISTQLIECGVDISFGAVVRFAAGLDSILQAAGRCNRHGEVDLGAVHIVRPDGKENLDSLEDIKEGRSAFLNLLHECRERLARTDFDLSDPEIMEHYFKRYFYNRAGEMLYPVRTGSGKSNDTTLLRMLGANDTNSGWQRDSLMLQQSFASAAQKFAPIDEATQGIIVPYGQGREIIARLCSEAGMYQRRELLRQAQRFSVNVYQNVFKQLKGNGAIYSIDDDKLMFLDEKHYHDTLGLCIEAKGQMSFQCDQ